MHPVAPQGRVFSKFLSQQKLLKIKFPLKMNNFFYRLFNIFLLWEGSGWAFKSHIFVPVNFRSHRTHRNILTNDSEKKSFIRNYISLFLGHTCVQGWVDFVFFSDLVGNAFYQYWVVV